jgi:FrmR/RcnR family transcriptional regulator, repressor of frmRAB operon
MSSAEEEKIKLVRRLGRIRGQVEAVLRALEEGASTKALLQQATACRGALDGFIAEVIEDHIRLRMVEERDRKRSAEAAEELISIVHSYIT